MSDIDRRIERAIQEGEDVLTAHLGPPPSEEEWADVAGMVLGDLADDYEGAVDAIKRVKTALEEVAFHYDISDGALAYLAAALECPTYHQRGQ